MREPALVAAAGVRFGFVAVGYLEAVAAPARAGGVRVVDLEARLLQRLDEVDRRALEVLDARRIDDDADAVELRLAVAFGCAAVEAERVLEAAAPAAADRDAQHLGLAGRLLRHQRLHLARSTLGERQGCRLAGFDSCHLTECTRALRGQKRAYASATAAFCATCAGAGASAHLPGTLVPCGCPRSLAAAS